jgi:UDP-N-acetylglucosamine--N-acetylmuramyl-(pentapeptide) pyrophosphoryl-undecaprenol N-acetylglucosamine transferase
VLVPLPIATRDHQTANAAALVRVGGAVLVPDADFDADRLVREVSAMLESSPGGSPKLAAMADAARSLARTDAADRVADLVEEYARTPRSATS